MAQFETITPTTELEAVNEVLSVIGEAPITQGELDSPSLPDVSTAVRIFRGTMRGVLSRGWRFNTEFGYEIGPTDDSPYSWADTEGTTTSLNIFEAPSDLITWDLTQTSEQMSQSAEHGGPLDLIIRPPRDYTGTAEMVFYDRKLNRDGLDADEFDFLYINPTWFWDFEDCPESFRQYVTIKSGRRLQARKVGDEELAVLTEREENEALANLFSDQGLKEKANFLDNAHATRRLGRHSRRRRGRFLDRRDSPGLS